MLGTVLTTAANEVVLSTDGTKAYVADGAGGLQIIDISAPPHQLGTVPTTAADEVVLNRWYESLCR